MATRIAKGNSISPDWNARTAEAINTEFERAFRAIQSLAGQSGDGVIDLADATGVLAVDHGGTGLATWAQGDLVYASAANVLAGLPKNTTATRYLSNTGASNNPAWAQVDIANGVTGTLPVANGGTGLTTLTAHALYVGNGTSAPTALAVGATGTVLIGTTGADPSFSANPVITQLTAAAIITASGALTITPAAGSGVTVALSTTGDFVVNTNQFVVDTSAASVGIGTAAPSAQLHTTGSVRFATFGAGLLATDANGNLSVVTSGSSFVANTFSFAGHPQGNVAAAPGSTCVNTDNGKRYFKRGGASTAYGWYPEFEFAAPGDVPWFATPSALNADSNAYTRANVFGYWGASDDGQFAFTPTGATTLARVLVGGKIYASFACAATTGTNMYINSTTAVKAGVNVFDDDFDIWIDMRTGPAITTVRLWFGITTAVITDLDTLGLVNGAAALTYRTTIPDGGWVGYSAAASASSVTATVANIAADTVYRLRIRFKRAATATLYYSVNDGTEVSKTTDIPGTGVNAFVIFGLTTKANAARALLWRSMGGAFGSPTA